MLHIGIYNECVYGNKTLQLQSQQQQLNTLIIRLVILIVLPKKNTIKNAQNCKCNCQKKKHL